jgi:hypothetical protein
MIQADSVHSTPPTNTSAIDDNPSPTKPPAVAQDASVYLPTDVTPEEVFQAIGRLRKEARDEIERLIRFLDDTDNHMELEPSLGWPEPTGKGDYGTYGDSRDEGCTNLGVTDDREAEPEHEEDDADSEPSLGSHELPSGAVCYLQSQSLGEIDVEGEHDGREPGEDDEPALDWHDTEPQFPNAGGSMHADETEPSLGSTSTINQEAWAFGMSGDREQGTTRNFKRKATGTVLDRSNVRWPDGSAFDPANIPRSNVVAVRSDGLQGLLQAIDK